MNISRFVQCVASFAVASGVVLAAAPLGQAQTAGQDIHNAGTSTTNAAKDTGSAVKKGTTTGYDKTKQGTKTAAKDTGSAVKKGTTTGYDKTKQGTKTVADKTKEGTVKGYDKTKEGVQHVVGAKSGN
jgi:hypothetical protein